MKKEKTIKEIILSVKKGKTKHIPITQNMNVTGYRQEAVRLNEKARIEHKAKEGQTAYTVSVTKKAGYLTLINNL